MIGRGFVPHSKQTASEHLFQESFNILDNFGSETHTPTMLAMFWGVHVQYLEPTRSTKEMPMYILNGNASPFFSISCKVSSPQALVSSIKGGEQILSSARK